MLSVESKQNILKDHLVICGISRNELSIAINILTVWSTKTTTPEVCQGEYIVVRIHYWWLAGIDFTLISTIIDFEFKN